VDIKEDLPQKKRHQADTFSDKYASFDLNPVSLFEFFFDDDVLAMVEKYNKSYAMQKGKHDFDISADDIGLFIAILYTSGYAPLRWRRQYWEPADDVQNVAINKAMKRNIFWVNNAVFAFCRQSESSDIDGEWKIS